MMGSAWCARCDEPVRNAGPLWANNHVATRSHVACMSYLLSFCGIAALIALVYGSVLCYCSVFTGPASARWRRQLG